VVLPGFSLHHDKPKVNILDLNYGNFLAGAGPAAAIKLRWS
jgi:hypothetical protein